MEPKVPYWQAALFLCVLVFLAFFGAYSGTYSQKPIEPRIPPNDKVAEHKNDADPAGYGTIEKPFIVEIRKTPQEKAETAQHNQNESSTANYTLGLAIGTLLLGAATWGLVCIARKTAHNQLRAYVALEDIYFLYKGEERTDGEHRQFTNIHRIRVRNYGLTPAHDMAVWITRSLQAPENVAIARDSEPTFPPQHLGPSHRFGTRLRAEPLTFPNTQHFFTYGQIIYRDIYGIWWVRSFCYEYIPPRTFTPHGRFNTERRAGRRRPY